MHTMSCKVPLPHPLMFAGKDPKQNNSTDQNALIMLLPLIAPRQEGGNA